MLLADWLNAEIEEEKVEEEEEEVEEEEEDEEEEKEVEEEEEKVVEEEEEKVEEEGEVEEVEEEEGGETSMNATGTCLFGHLNPSGRGLSTASTPDLTRPP